MAQGKALIIAVVALVIGFGGGFVLRRLSCRPCRPPPSPRRRMCEPRRWLKRVERSIS
jgi:hypothetical protein